MSDHIIMLDDREEVGLARRIHLTGDGVCGFLEELKANGLQGELPLIVRALFLRGMAGILDSRPLFKGNGWDESGLEIHLPSENGRDVARDGVEAYLETKFDRKAEAGFGSKWRSAIAAVVKRSPGFAGGGLSPFPKFDAPLVRIPKRRPGEFRVIATPSTAQKRAARWMLPTLDKWIDYRLPIHGFVHGRNPVTNARVHLGFRYSLGFDLEDFFDHVTIGKLVAAGLPLSLAVAVTDGSGIARQGYPTSPTVANIAFQAVDRALLDMVAQRGQRIAYSRYADDLTFSADSWSVLQSIRGLVEDLVPRHGFRISHRKTTSWSDHAGRRMITGVAVSRDGLFAPREIRRRLRAARHQGRIPQASGLAEWNRLREPNVIRRSE